MIKKIHKDNVDSVMKIWLDASIEAHDFINRQYWIDNYEIVKNQFIPKADTFIFDEDNKIKGFISVLNKNYIGALFINIENQNHGIGSRLIEYVKEKYDKLLLNVYVDNNKAVTFYKKHGFEIINESLDESTNRVEFTMKYEK